MTTRNKVKKFWSGVFVWVVVVVLYSLESEATFRGNYLGCLFSTDVCSEYELCVDDGLFGACKDLADTLEVKPIRLTREQVTELEENMQHLIDEGYTWHDEYAQCLVKHFVREYTRGEIKVRPPEDCRDVEQQSKLRNYERKLGHMEQHAYNDGTNVVLTPAEYLVESRLEKMGKEEFGAYLSHMSDDDLENVKNFLLLESSSGSDNDSVVKKSPLSTKTSVVVHFHPADSSERGSPVQNNDLLPSDRQRLEEIKSELEAIEDLGSSKAAMGSHLPREEKEKEEEEEGRGRGEGREEIKSNRGRSSPAPMVPFYTRPFYKYFMAHGNSHASALNQQNGGGAIFSKDGVVKAEPIEYSRMSRNRQKYLVTMYVLCGFVVVATFLAVVLYFVRRRTRFREKISRWANKDRQDSTGDYQDLCRQHMQSRLSEKLIDSPTSLMGKQNKAVLPDPQSPPSAPRKDRPNTRTSSTNSSTSSWTEEPISSNMDISTGHLILSYMEDHMKNKDRLQKEWEEICSNDGEPCSIVAGIEPMNMRKNRCTDILPYEHSRIKLNPTNNVSGSDYINANYITDHDPRNPAYIATQGPLPHTVADFWQMIWEQNSVVIVNLTRLWENSTSICHRYWPEEGTDLYHIYEVQLISEHNLCEDFVVRSLFLKNLQVSETRTITQFHFLTWSDHGVPASIKVLLDFRRKVNKSYRGRSSPMVVHCSDGAGRTGTYCLIDMSLNRLSKGAKEIDIAAALEHLRDQRVNMVRTKEQFEFALAAVAEEVHAVLNFAQP